MGDRTGTDDEDDDDESDSPIPKNTQIYEKSKRKASNSRGRKVEALHADPSKGSDFLDSSSFMDLSLFSDAFTNYPKPSKKVNSDSES